MKINWQKNLTMTAYCLAFGQLGFAFISIGPVLIILSEQIGVELSLLSYIFPGRSVAYLLGSSIGGLIIHKIKGHWLLASGLIFSGIGTAAIPFVPYLWMLCICIAVQGIAMGFLDTGVNVLTASLYGDKAAPFLQLIHFWFGLGAFVAPLLVELSLTLTNSYRWAFIGTGLSFLLVALMLVLLPSPSAKENKAYMVRKGGYSLRQWSLVLMGSFLLLLYVGAELSVSGFLLTYCVEQLNMTQSQGDYVTFSFWFTLAAGRLIAIPISMKISAGLMLLINFLGCLVTLIFVVIYPDSVLVMKICMPITGIFMASTFPSVLTLVEEYIQLTGKFATTLVIGGAIGELIIPFIMSAVINSPSHPWIALILIILFSNAISIAILGIFYFVGRQVKEHKRASQISFGYIPQIDEQIDESEPQTLEMTKTSPNTKKYSPLKNIDNTQDLSQENIQ